MDIGGDILNSTNEQTTEPLFAEERRKEIIILVQKRKKVTVPELCDYFNVSPATIRNDLRELEKSELLKRTHGGAIDITKVGFELNSNERMVKNLEAKQAIARKALAFIDDGDVIILDTGTTTFELAKLLKGFLDLTVVVNDISIAQYLEDMEGINLIQIGGTVRKGFHCTVGPIASKTLSELSVDKVFLATNGFTVDRGCTTPDINQAEIKEVMTRISTKVITLCDSSKLGQSTFAQFAKPSQIDLLITDHLVDKSLAYELSSQNFDFIIAD